MFSESNWTRLIVASSLLVMAAACTGQPDSRPGDDDSPSSEEPGDDDEELDRASDAGRLTPPRDGGTSAASDAAKAPSRDAGSLARVDGSAVGPRDAEAGGEDARASAAPDAQGGSGPQATDGGSTTPSGAEDASGDCVVPALPAAAALSAQPKHPDPFKLLDGARMTMKSQWPCRRAEIKAQVAEYESGPKPTVAPEDVQATWSGNTLAITVGSGDKSVRFSVKIARPASAAERAVPLVIAFKAMTLDESVFSQNGVATLVFDHDALGAQSGAGSRGTGLFYDLYGKDHPASSIVAWAWGVSRILDALEKTEAAKIDPKRVAVTGCSRYGKGALFAGALDERIALTIPQESGAGGSASWRVSQAQSAMGVNVQTLSNAAGEQPWFRASFGPTFGGANVTKLPFDHHMVMGLVAPRPLLVIDNPIDWLGIDSSFTAGSIAHTIWEALGVGDRMGYSQSSGHAHCQFPSAQRALLDSFVKKFLLGTASGETGVVRAVSAKADLGFWMDWTPPALR